MMFNVFFVSSLFTKTLSFRAAKAILTVQEHAEGLLESRDGGCGDHKICGVLNFYLTLPHVNPI